MTEIAEFRHVREGLADPLRTGGSVILREESLVRMEWSDIVDTLEQLRQLATARGLTIAWEHDKLMRWYVIRWGHPLPAEPAPTLPPYPSFGHSASQDEPRSSGWAS